MEADGIDARRGRGVALDFALVFLLALACRGVYLLQMRGFALFERLVSDSRRYDEWAAELAAGDWLGEGVFYQAPLYPYFLGVLQTVLGRDLDAIRIVQVVLGSAACGLVALAGRAWLSRAAGLVAGLLLAFYPPAIFFDGLIQKTVLDQVLIAVLLFLASRAGPAPALGRCAALGAVLGLLALTRENALVWALVVPAWLAWSSRAEHVAPGAERASGPSTRVLAFACGAVLVLLPVALRNLLVGGELALTTSQLGPNFYIGNHPGADGTYEPLKPGYGDPAYERRDATELAEVAVGRALTPGEVSAYWLDRSLEFIRSEPGSWLRLLGKKWLMVWNEVEVEDADDLYLNAEHSTLLRGLGWLDFGWLAPLAAVGALATLGSWRRLWLLHALVLSLAATVAAFYVFARYRQPLVLPLAVLAGGGVCALFAAARARRWGRLAALLAVLAITALVVHAPVHPRPRPSPAALNNLASAQSDLGRAREARETYARALRLDPGLYQARYNLGLLCLEEGDAEQARAYLEAALAANPAQAEAWNNLGLALERTGEPARATESFARAVELDPDLREARLNLGRALARAGRAAEARPILEALVAEWPEDPTAQNLLGALLARSGDMEGALRCFREAVRLAPSFASAHGNLANALAALGRGAEAEEHRRLATELAR